MSICLALPLISVYRVKIIFRKRGIIIDLIRLPSPVLQPKEEGHVPSPEKKFEKLTFLRKKVYFFRSNVSIRSSMKVQSLLCPPQLKIFSSAFDPRYLQIFLENKIAY